jgi:VWFA-related protein
MVSWVFAQTPTSQAPAPDLQLPPPAFRAAIDAQVIAVSVLDAKRQRVRGLAAADFTVRDGDRPRRIIAVTEVRVPSRNGGAPGAVRAVENSSLDQPGEHPGRLIVIAFDRTILAASQGFARDAAQIVIDGLGPNDFAAVVFSNGGMKPQGFTNDAALLRGAIAQPMAAWAERDSAGNVEHGNPGECFCGLCGIQVITRVAQALERDTFRRKVLIFIGREPAIDDWWYGPTHVPPVGSRPTIDCRPDIQRERRIMLQAIEAANLTVHVVSPDGLETAVVPPSFAGRGGGVAQAAQQEALAGARYRQDAREILADFGGGRVFESNTPGDVRAIFEETASYYLIGFEPLTSAPGFVRHLEVSVARRGLVVQTPRLLRAESTSSSP